MSNEDSNSILHITLPSNASMDLYPTNKPQNFKTMLGRPLHFNGLWQVSLRSIAYPNNYYNIDKAYNITVSFKREKETGPAPSIEFTLNAGRYDSIPKLAAYLEKLSKDAVAKKYKSNEYTFINRDRPLIIDYNEISSKITMNGNGDNVDAEMKIDPPELWNVLGFANLAKDDIVELKNTGTRQASLTSQRPGFFVYTDIVKPTRIGDTFGKLLQYVPLNITDEIGFKEYINPSYFELESNEIQTIEIQILDSAGKPLIFPTGQTNLQLEFKRCDLV